MMASFLCRRLIATRMSTCTRRIYQMQRPFRLSNQICACQNIFKPTYITAHEYCTKKPPVPQTATSGGNETDNSKLTIFQKFKKMYKEYWYVLVPVHLITSSFWIGGFYYMAKSGVDVVALLESLKVSEVIVNPLRDSSMGYVAITYALYKVATPFRYTVTLGGTTLAINYFKKWGWIKPVPSTQKLRELYNEKKEVLLNRKATPFVEKDATSSNQTLDKFNQMKMNERQEKEMIKNISNRFKKKDAGIKSPPGAQSISSKS